MEITEKRISPIFYKTTDIWLSLKVLDDYYYPVDTSFQSSEERPYTLFVKKKIDQNINLKQLSVFLQDSTTLLSQINPESISKNSQFKIFIQRIFGQIKSFKKEEQNRVLQYYLHCIYMATINDQSDFLDIIFQYLVNKYDYHRSDKVLDKNFISNAHIIIAFHQASKVLKQDKSKSCIFIDSWNQNRELHLLKKQIRSKLIASSSLGQKMKQRYLKQDFKALVLETLFDNINEFQELELLMKYLYQNQMNKQTVSSWNQIACNQSI